MLNKTVTVFVAALSSSLLYAAPQATPDAAQGAPAAAPAGTGSPMTPVQRADSAPQGSLKNPYKDDDADVVAAGGKLYLSYGCNGCHGGTGGGGMCPPLTNDTWVYGGDDDTLFRLVAYGSQTLQGKGYSRKAQESVVGPMPQMGQLMKTDDELWRILTFVRSNYHGSPECKFGCKGS
ncbi:MAG TPA: c-type cytochrome [Steroidobacteraceae bacterium]|nr:c-type cytochrome [Steroidobacteraceae bacterium]